MTIYMGRSSKGTAINSNDVKLTSEQLKAKIDADAATAAAKKATPVPIAPLKEETTPPGLGIESNPANKVVDGTSGRIELPQSPPPQIPKVAPPEGGHGITRPTTEAAATKTDGTTAPTGKTDAPPSETYTVKKTDKDGVAGIVTREYEVVTDDGKTAAIVPHKKSEKTPNIPLDAALALTAKGGPNESVRTQTQEKGFHKNSTARGYDTSADLIKEGNTLVLANELTLQDGTKLRRKGFTPAPAAPVTPPPAAPEKKDDGKITDIADLKKPTPFTSGDPKKLPPHLQERAIAFANNPIDKDTKWIDPRLAKHGGVFAKNDAAAFKAANPVAPAKPPVVEGATKPVAPATPPVVEGAAKPVAPATPPVVEGAAKPVAPATPATKPVAPPPSSPAKPAAHVPHHRKPAKPDIHTVAPDSLALAKNAPKPTSATPWADMLLEPFKFDFGSSSKKAAAKPDTTTDPFDLWFKNFKPENTLHRD